jgi:trehalose/maltose hydrolase-like predicted phosphorylase
MQIRNVMSPDENHVGDNDLYTNLLANWLSVGRKWPSSQTPLPFKIPRDKDGLITYDGDLGMGYKQAAAVLSIYPLQFPEAESHAVQMLNRFEPHVIKSGPAMSDSIHAIIHARFDNPPSYRAYEDWIKSWKPFTSNRFLLFSEKRNKEQTYFTTGAAGALQTVLYGFLGFRIDSQQQPDSLWHTSLMGNTMLSIKPNLPPLWKSVKIENLSVLGTHYSFRITHQGLQVLPGGK